MIALSHIICSNLAHTFALTSGQTPRGAILSFLLEQACVSCPDLPGRVGVHTPFTE